MPEPLEKLKRPREVEEEIRDALELDDETLKRRAAAPRAEGFSSECLVHLARRFLRRGQGREAESWAEALVPPLLHRADHSLKRNLRGPWAEEAREEILGRLALLLLESGSGGDFFEVRFDLALKRLRIDICRRLHRRPRPESLDGGGRDGHNGDDGVRARQRAAKIEAALARQSPNDLSAEEKATLHQALSSLPAAERQVLVLRHLFGLPVVAKDETQRTIASTLGVSERTVRNLLRRARERLLPKIPQGITRGTPGDV